MNNNDDNLLIESINVLLEHCGTSNLLKKIFNFSELSLIKRKRNREEEEILDDSIRGLLKELEKSHQTKISKKKKIAYYKHKIE